MFHETVQMFSYDFFVYAFIAGIFISLSASLLGVNLVLKRYSMIGDGLAHVGFGAFALTAAINPLPTWVALPIVGIAAVLLLRVRKSSKIKGDALIAVISSGSLAAGLILLTAFEVTNDINRYMFGSIFALEKSDVIISAVCSLIIIALYLIFYNRILLVTIDEDYAHASGINVSKYNTLIAVLTAVIIVLGMRLMGALLISGLVIFPPLSSMRVFGGFKKAVFCSALISVTCFTAGLFFTFYYSLPPGACILMMNLLVFILFTLVGKIRQRG
ncbi:MAG: metal ABC transporter permease [Oscillospiraceae bacterium]|nr:metal ABC transporter permease [Oscillospiraceae bacterium]